MLSAGLIATLLAAQTPAGSAAQPQHGGPAATPQAVAADTGTMRHANKRTPPLAYASRLISDAGGIHLDGKLDEPIWAHAVAMTEFSQTAPHEGAPATERTEVRLAFDDAAIYVAARMYDSERGGVRRQLARRDATTEADVFEVALDSYHDHNTAFVFNVNPSGVKVDRVAGSDGFSSDDGWDPIWEVATRVDSAGWVAEFRIPLSQLRFSTAKSQIWGVNFLRRIQRKAETDVFAYSRPSDRGYASFFAHLHGIEDLPALRRLEMLPYVTMRQERIDPDAANNPFNDGSRHVAGVGLDAKYGLTSSLTLDATINPDFGQVDADPAFVNLSAFEQFLNERRPFFVEGADIFNFNANSQLFYSRRIGRPPQGSADSRGGFVDQPDHATILGAAKLSGRVGPWSLGVLQATTAREHATVDSAGRRFEDSVEPLTNYVVARGLRDWRSGADRLGFIATAVNRRIDNESLAFLRRSAYVGGVDFGHRFAGNVYNLTGSLVGSRISGDTLAIQRAQLSSARYYQRPDAKQARYEPNATAMSGWSGFVNLGKEAGDYQFGLNASATSPGFETNDAGFQTGADQISYFAFGNRRWTKPGKVFRFAFAGNNLTLAKNFDGVRTGLNYNVNLQGTFLNYWNADAHLNRGWRSPSANLTRGGPLADVPAFWSVSGGVGTDTRRRFSTYNGGSYSHNEIGGWDASYFASVDFRPTSATTLSIQPSYNRSNNLLQYVQSQSDAAATSTFARQYIFSAIEQHSLDLTTRVNVTFRPNLSLQFYAQPFIATGDYDAFKELTRPRSLDYVVYGRTGSSTLACFNARDLAVSCDVSGVAYYVGDPDGIGGRRSVRIANRDFDSRSLSGNAVMRWEYRPGSTVFFVWSSSCAAGTSDPRFNATEAVRRLCAGPSDNVFAVKANYWLSF